LGVKNAGMPRKIVPTFAATFGSPVKSRSKSTSMAATSTRDQKSRSRSKRRSRALPAISAALMAPIDVPMIQSGSMPASCSASYTPTW
jgi:hypothetical protein